MAVEGRLAMGDGHDMCSAFRGVSDELYCLLLLHDFEGFPRIRAALPRWPSTEFWASNMGKITPNDSLKEAHAFWSAVKLGLSQYGRKELSECKAVDYGAGWGRIVRLLAKDVPASRLFAVDPNEDLLLSAKECGVECQFVQSDWQSEQKIEVHEADFAISFGVFTHASPRLIQNMFCRLSEMLREGALLTITVRPGAMLYAETGEATLLSVSELENARRRFNDNKHTFLPYERGADWGVSFVPTPLLEQSAQEWFRLVEEVPLLQNWTHKVLHFTRI
jgi:2-polyprenyl-3-methyl-5-hydroxy-6-metoxy-1,4-benzoquinol methylase